MIRHVTGVDRDKRETPSGWRYALPVALVALLGTLISAGLAQRQRVSIQEHTRGSVQEAVTSTTQQAVRALGSLRGSMAAFPGMYAVAAPVSASEFSQFTQTTFAYRDDVRYVLSAVRVGADVTVQHVVGDADVTEGFNLMSDPVSAAAIRQARSTEQTVLVAQRTSQLGGPAAVLAFTPVVSSGTLRGVVVAGVDISQWMAQASTGVDGNELALTVVDESMSPPEVLWTAGDPVDAQQNVRTTIPLSALQTLSVTGGATPKLLAAAPTWRPWFVLLVGMLVTVIVCALLWWWLDARRIKRTADDLQQATNRLRFLAERDALTGLSHRDGLRSWLEEWDGRNPGRDLGVLYIDLDGFKEVNTTWGHLSGDLVLRQIAHRLSSLVDDRDCAIARISGDQFVLMRAVDLGPLRPLAIAAQTLIADPIPVGDRDIQLSSSIGIAVRPEDGSNLDTLINNADIAVRVAKTLPGNSIVRFDPSMAAEDAREQQLGREFRTAMRDPSANFELRFQPQVDMRTGRLVAAEALIRWNRNGLPVSPGEFLPAALAYGVMPDLGRWILRESCYVVQRWRRDVPAIVAVNVDAVQLDSGFADVMASVLQETGCSPEWVMVEITEGAAMGVQAQRELDRVRALGVSISIDDFGTGFSSLSRLADLPTEQVKIDRAFVQGLGQSNETLEIVRTIAALARALNLEILAEGVETVGQAQVLMSEGIHIAQGFLFAEPMSAEDCLTLWKRGVSVPSLHG